MEQVCEKKWRKCIPYLPAVMATAPPPFMGVKARRSSSADKQFLGDYMNTGSNLHLQKALQKTGDRQILFADTVIKVNKRTKMQERILLITENHICNVDKNTNYKIKRKIQIKDVSSIVLSTHADNFFLIKVPSEYDYFFVSAKKTEIVLRLLTAYQRLTDTPLEVEFIDNFEYVADIGVVREVEFKKTSDGVTTHFTTKKSKSKGS